MARIDDGRPLAGAAQEVRDVLDGVLRGRESDAQQTIATEGAETLQRQGEMAAALVGGDRVDLIDDHRPGGRQHAAAGLRTKQDVKRLGRGGRDVRRAATHALAFGGRRVASADPGADVDVGQAAPAEFLADAAQRRFQIALDVVGERLERRDIDDVRLVLELAGEAPADKIVDRGHEGGKGLAGPGRSCDQRMAAGLDQRPGFTLGRRGGDEASLEPGGDGRMKQRTRVHNAVSLSEVPLRCTVNDLGPSKYGPRTALINSNHWPWYDCTLTTDLVSLGQGPCPTIAGLAQW